MWCCFFLISEIVSSAFQTYLGKSQWLSYKIKVPDNLKFQIWNHFPPSFITQESGSFISCREDSSHRDGLKCLVEGMLSENKRIFHLLRNMVYSSQSLWLQTWRNTLTEWLRKLQLKSYFWGQSWVMKSSIRKVGCFRSKKTTKNAIILYVLEIAKSVFKSLKY